MLTSRCLECSYCMSNFLKFVFWVKAPLFNMLACTADSTENLTDKPPVCSSMQLCELWVQLCDFPVGVPTNPTPRSRIGDQYQIGTLLLCIYASALALLKDSFILFQVHLNVCCDRFSSPYWLWKISSLDNVNLRDWRQNLQSTICGNRNSKVQLKLIWGFNQIKGVSSKVPVF